MRARRYPRRQGRQGPRPGAGLSVPVHQRLFLLNYVEQEPNSAETITANELLAVLKSCRGESG